MKQNFGRSRFSGWSRKGLIAQLAVMAAAWMLLTSCSTFQSREVTISSASASEMESYYRDESFSREGLSFESENFLRGNMEQDDLTQDPEVTLHKLNGFYDISEDPKFLRIAADYCRWLAMESGDEEFSVRAHLSALYYLRNAYKVRNWNDDSGFDFSDFRMMQIYNDSCRGIFSFLKSHKLLANNSFSLLDLEERRYFFNAPHYHLSVPDDTVEDFSLCSDYSVKALMQKNRQPGVGVPLVGFLVPQETHEILRKKLPLFAHVFEKLNKEKYEELEKMRRKRGDSDGHLSVSGLYDLDPDSLFIRSLADSPMKKGLVFHSIIGDNEQADHPGGTDGVVPYSSSHLDNAESEVVVRSWHSIHRSPAAMRELPRILRLHLRELDRNKSGSN